ncbi:hypothetical protein UCRPC4_g01729 [Phaeomoniella chlamydospora]|uniref:Nuclear protein es2 n=1 Tax=Phaeomoniella chlamydospora TaxID=158046 RepID=A0A0G2HA83_PHACM|nr:hypothetical protein UCRPC4_g01729 [Phaeomoniella chlamydospora]
MPPPPPPKRIRRPATVIDEEEYTAALSDIIARDFFPGLNESKAQQEYLNALESNEEDWIRSAGRKLTEAMTPQRGRRQARATRLSTPTPYQEPNTSFSGGETPKGWGGATPSVAGTEESEAVTGQESSAINTSNLSLSEFQSKYTSEDNESFNSLLDEQNEKQKEKHAFLWNDNKILAPRQLLHRAREAKRLKQSAEADEKALMPLTIGATSDRPAQPTAWKGGRPDNTLMFVPPGIEDTHETVAQNAENASRAAPKQTVYLNTRFRPSPPEPSPSIPASPSLSAVRDAIAGRPRLSASEQGSDVFTGAETPRVNGYAFVDEDEPDQVLPLKSGASEEPSYRDLLSGQFATSSSPSPFTINAPRRREDLHHRLVDKTAREKREKRKETIKSPVPKFPSSPFIGRKNTNGSATPGTRPGITESKTGMMTPAARKLMERIGGRTPLRDGNADSRTKNAWTPTPKRKSQLGK